MTVNSIIHANVTAVNIKYILMLRVIILIKNHKKTTFLFRNADYYLHEFLPFILKLRLCRVFWGVFYLCMWVFFISQHFCAYVAIVKEIVIIMIFRGVLQENH